MPRKRYAIVGLGARSAMYSDAIWDTYRDHAELVGFCDVNATRMAYYNRLAAEQYGLPPIASYRPEGFGTMLAEQRVETAIVTSVDRTHHRYIIAALEAGCDVITEKPLTVDAEKCQAIIDAQRRTGGKLIVTFNYRYAPRASKVKELLQNGAIGKVLSVHFEWLLDTYHGADYFRRWHRDKRNSGGLLVHKATHHFDLVNWWLDSSPETVFAFGDLKFYGRENAEERGETRFYERVHGSEAAKGDPFALDLTESERLRGLYLEAEHEDGYFRDQSVFGNGISIEDDMAVLVRYQHGATMSYHLTAYSPREGLRVAFNGTKGRIDLEVEERPYVSGAKGDFNMPELRGTEPLPEETRPEIIVQPLWGKQAIVPIEQDAGGHGGGDVRLLEDLFAPERPHDPLGRAAGPLDGVRSILTGIAANRAMQTGQPVRIADLVHF
jgi:predicted dehydrogenase